MPLFIAPLMLIGLAGVSLPVIIHLLDRSKSTPEDWPSLRFLKLAHQHSARRTRIKHLLVLLARCLLLALIVLAMAQPYRLEQTWAKPVDLPTTVVIVLDNSYSMGCRDAPGSVRGENSGGSGGDGAATRFEQAKKLALAQIAKLALKDEVALILAANSAVLLTERPTRDHEHVRQLIEEAALSTRPGDLGVALTAAFALGQLDAQTQPTPSVKIADDQPESVHKQRKAWRHVLLLTDMQRSAWASLLDRTLIEQVTDPLPVTVIAVGDDRTANRFIRQVRVQRGAAGGLPVEVEIVIDTPGAISGGQATLWIDGQRASAPELIPSTTGSITLNAPMPPPGVHLCTVELEGDRLSIDDRRYFALNIGGAGRVSIVDGDPSDIPRLSETFFLQGALKVVRSRSEAAGLGLDVELIDADELDQSAKLAQTTCLVLANVARLDGSALTNIENFLRSGGNVLVSLGDRVDLAHYNRDFRFLPVKLERRLGDPNRSRAYALVVQRPEHPIIGGQLDLTATRFFAFIGSNPETLREGGTIIASFSNGSPALVEGTFRGTSQGRGRDDDRTTRVSGGKVLLLTGPLDADWSNLPARRVFVPLIDRIFSYLTQKRMTSRSITVGQPIRFIGPSTLDRRPVTITSPSKSERMLLAQLDSATNQAIVDFDETDQVGHYRVQADVGFAAGGAFAVNVDTKESILLRIDRQALRQAFGDHPIRFIESRATDLGSWHRGEDDELAKDRTDYWPALLAAAMAMFMLETLLSNLFTRRQAVTPPPTSEYLGRRRGDGTTVSRTDGTA